VEKMNEKTMNFASITKKQFSTVKKHIKDNQHALAGSLGPAWHMLAESKENLEAKLAWLETLHRASSSQEEAA